MVKPGICFHRYRRPSIDFTTHELGIVSGAPLILDATHAV